MTTKRRRSKPATVPLLYAIEPHLLNIGNRKAYEQAKAGELVDGVPIIDVGRLHRVPTSALERVLGIELDLADLDRWEAEQQLGRRTPAARA